MSLAQGNNTPTRPRIEPGSPDSESDAQTTSYRPVRSPMYIHKPLRITKGNNSHRNGPNPNPNPVRARAISMRVISLMHTGNEQLMQIWSIDDK